MSIVVGIGLSYYGKNLAYKDNKKKGYLYMAIGILVLFVNAVYFVLQLKK